MSVPRLLVISGPSASGKSTAASALARGFRAGGHSAANLDLDRVYLMLEEDMRPMADPRLWRMARRAAAALVDQLVRDGIELIIVEGAFWTEAERREFSDCLATPVQPVYVTLPEVLGGAHADFGAVPRIPSDMIIDSTTMAIEEVVTVMGAMLDDVANQSVTAGGVLQPLFADIDCLQIPVPDLDSGLAFYRDALGQTLLWRTQAAAGLQLSDSRAELVLQTERSELEVNLSVASADSAAQRFVRAGGVLVVPPFDIAIGRCTVVQDPWRNRLVLLDHRRGRLVTDADRSVVGTSVDGAPRDAC